MMTRHAAETAALLCASRAQQLSRAAYVSAYAATEGFKGCTADSAALKYVAGAAYTAAGGAERAADWAARFAATAATAVTAEEATAAAVEARQMAREAAEAAAKAAVYADRAIRLRRAGMDYVARAVAARSVDYAAAFAAAFAASV